MTRHPLAGPALDEARRRAIPASPSETLRILWHESALTPPSAALVHHRAGFRGGNVCTSCDLEMPTGPERLNDCGSALQTNCAACLEAMGVRR